MKNIEILEGFEREINLLDNIIEKPTTDESLYWLNQAVSKFVKLRFNGDFIHKTSYEQNEKRRADLINLFKQKEYNSFTTSNHNSYDSYFVKYPEDFAFVLNEDVVISDLNNNDKKDVPVFECTQDSFMYRVNNSLTDFHYNHKYARPLRIRNVEGCELLTDKNYKISKYTLGYLRKPNEIKLGNQYDDEYTDFQDIIMPEIIKMAAQMYLENKKSDRYKTIVAETSTQE